MAALPATTSAYPAGFDDPTRRIPGMPEVDDDGFGAQKGKKKRKAKPTPAPQEEKVEEAPEPEPVVEEPVVEEKPVEKPKKQKKPKDSPKPEAAAPAAAEAAAPAAPVAAAPAAAAEPAEMTTDKLLRKAKKKLAEIDALIEKKNGAAMSPEEQLKVDRKPEFEAEIKYLEKVQKGIKVEPPKKKEAPVPKKDKTPPVPEIPKKAEKAAPVPVPLPAKAANVPLSAEDKEAAAKRLRNVNKKLKEVEALLEKQKEVALTEDQLAKVARKAELTVELKHLTKVTK